MARRKQKRARERAGETRLLQLRLEQLELASAHDGAFRGAPEPLVMIGVYRVGGASMTLVDRHLQRAVPIAPYPAIVELGESMEVRIPRVEGMKIVVLGLALEEDGGGGVAHLFGQLGAPDRLALWPTEEVEPDPVSLADWALRDPIPAPASATVHVLDDGKDLRDAVLGDDWIGGSVFHLPDRRANVSGRRLRFRSADGKNDWTLVLRVRVV